LEADSPGAGPGWRVLLVDDEVSATEVLALVLGGEGFEVTAAADARQALERLAEARPQLVITDFMMPGMNGAELVAKIRQADPAYADIPVLMISGAPESALRPYGVKYDAFIRKPFGLDQLLDQVRELLRPR
jgi:CheY-like chemotaxis protein